MDFRKTSVAVLVSIPFLAGVVIGTAGTSAFAALRGSAVFSDVPAGSYYDMAAGEMYDLGIMTGTNGKFMPGDYVNRAQMAVIIKRLRDEMNGIAPVVDEPDTGSSSSSSVSRSSRSSKSSSSSKSSTNPASGTFSFTTGTFNFPETASKATFSVVRNGGSKGTVSVKYATSDESTKEGEDYTANGGTLTFSDGETSKVITVGLKNDTLGEGNETFKLTLSDATNGAGLGTNATATVMILDDEKPGPLLSSSSSSSTSGGTAVAGAGELEFAAVTYGAMEHDGSMTVTVRRVNGSQGTVSVNYGTSDGTGKSSTDYTTTTGTLTFSGGETTQSFTVSLKDNANVEGNRKFNVALNSPSGGAILGNQKTAVVTIVDDENGSTGSGTFSFTTSNFWGSKGALATVTVQRLGSPKGTASVNYATSDMSAVTNTDYTPTSGTLTFLPGETQKIFRVQISSNAKSERQVQMILTNATGTAALGTDNTSATLTIQ